MKSEIHNCTMALPKEYWDSGSYDKWIRVCWALKNTNESCIDMVEICSQMMILTCHNDVEIHGKRRNE